MSNDINIPWSDDADRIEKLYSMDIEPSDFIRDLDDDFLDLVAEALLRGDFNAFESSSEAVQEYFDDTKAPLLLDEYKTSQQDLLSDYLDDPYDFDDAEEV